MQKRSLFDNAAALAVMRIAGAGIGFLTQVLLARILGAHNLGLFYAATSLAAVGGYVTSLGYSQIASRFAGRYREPHKERFFVAFVSRAAIDGLLAGGVAAALVVTISLLLPGVEPAVRVIYAVAGPMIVAATMLALFTNLAAAVRMFGWCYVPEGIVRPAVFLILTLLLYVVERPTAVSATILFGVLNALIAVVVVIVMLRALPRLTWPSRSSRRLARAWRREAGQLILLSLYINSFADIGILFATPFMASADVAVFGFCMKLSLLVGYVIQVAQQRTVPDLADARRNRDVAAMRDIVRGSLLFPVGLTLAAFVGCVVFGGMVLSVLGPQFAHGGTILAIMVACQLVRALAGPSAHLMTLRGAQRQSAVLCVGALVLLFVADAALAPMFGALGAAAAVFLSYTAWLICNGVALARLGEIRTDVFWALAERAAARRGRSIKPPSLAGSA